MDDELGMCRLCGEYRNDGCKCAPAQEEKEMDRDGVHTGGIKPDNPMQLPPSVGNRLVPGFLPRPEAAAEKRATDLRERWDRAYFAALTGLSGIDALSNDNTAHHAQSIANESIRRHADMMAARDAIIAEVVAMLAEAAGGPICEGGARCSVSSLYARACEIAGREE